MTAHGKLLDQILRGSSDANTDFASLCALLRRLRFQERIKGSHHIFTRDDLPEILNLQPRGHLAKAYQVKQVRSVILEYKLGRETERE